MEIIPAIDLKGGKCVRLYQGDYSQETVFSDDPVGVARRWEAAGARRLHLVDLDGAAEGKPCNPEVIGTIIAAVRIPVQIGGGIRTIETIRSLERLGAARMILGTAALESPDLIEEACRLFGEKIIVSIDAKEGYVRGRGWKAQGALSVESAVREMERRGVRRFIYTDITRDGTLTEPNFEEIKRFKSLTALPVIAAGGIASIAHLQKLAALGVEGAIVGKALYTGHVDLRQAITALSSEGNELAPKFDDRGLIPAIVQHAETGEVLMMAYMNAESLARTRATGQAWFWSRSRRELWHKGATSGNYLTVKEILIDCDRDTLLIKAYPAGPVCHTGNRTCFYRKLDER